MRAVKVLNNSLVLAINDAGEEVVLMGKGIGYQKAMGYQFGEEDVEKVFVLKDRELSRNIIRLAAETDSVYFELSEQVIKYAAEKYEMLLMEHIYLSMTDHIAFVVRRLKEGIVVPNFYMLDMKQFNPKEYAVGEYAVRLISEKLQLEIPEMEAGNIAFHFINAQANQPYNKQNLQIRQMTEDIARIVQYHYQLIYQKDSITYSRFITHVQLFAQRLLSGKLLPEEPSSELYRQIAAACRSEFQCVGQIARYIKENWAAELSTQEEMYLALHIHRILEDGAFREE